MKPEKQTFVEETLQFVAIAKRNNKRIAFWGWDADVISSLEMQKMFDGLDTIFISDEFPVQNIESCKITQQYHGVDEMYQTPEKLNEFKPDKICILDFNPYKAIRIYEILLREFKVDPMDIFGSSRMWQISTYVEGDTFNKLKASVPPSVPGGLIPKALQGVYNGLRYVVKNNIPGRIVNFGVSRGWSMYFIAQVLDHLGDTDREIVGFDGFRGFPQADSPLDMCNLKYRRINTTRTPTSMELAQETTEKNLAPHMHRMSLIPGDIVETISQIGDEPIALALFDMDDYTPTKVSLEPTYERLSPNGIFVMDHFTYASCGGFCIGQRIAMLEFLEKYPMVDFLEYHMFFKTVD